MFKKFRAFIKERQPQLSDDSPQYEEVYSENETQQTGKPKENNEAFVEHLVEGVKCVLPKRYTRIGICGGGTYGYVFNAFDQVTQKVVAIKKITQRSLNLLELVRFCRELKILTMLNHKNLITFYGAFTPIQTVDEFKEMYLITQFCAVTLQELIQTDQIHFSHKKISYLVHHALSGLQYLHKLEIVHRDIKPGNMVVDLETRTLKLIDFGMARQESFDMSFIGIGTYCYNSPELAFEVPYDNKTDMWSLGCTVYEMFTKRLLLLFRGMDKYKLEYLNLFGTPDDSFLRRIPHESVRNWILAQGQFPQVVWTQFLPNNMFPYIELTDPGNTLNAQNARSLLQGLLQFNAATRFNVNDALCHPYFESYRQTGYDLAEEEQNERTFDEWKNLLFNEIKQCEQDRNIL